MKEYLNEVLNEVATIKKGQ